MEPADPVEFARFHPIAEIRKLTRKQFVDLALRLVDNDRLTDDEFREFIRGYKQ